MALLGAGGMLGATWAASLAQTPLRDETGCALALRLLDLPDFDLRNEKHIDAAIAEDLALVINCAAHTDVDGAELNPEPAFEINGRAVGALAQRCAAVGATLVHYSTDYVFDGEASAPYAPDHARNPINAYGKSKALGEELVEQSGADYLLIRTSWLFAPHGRNFVRTMARLTRERASVSVVADQIGRPTSAAWLVEATRRLLDAGARGAQHVALDGACSWFELACAIAQSLGADCEVSPCASDEYPSPAARPRRSVLDLSRTTSLIGPAPAWRDELARALQILDLRSESAAG